MNTKLIKVFIDEKPCKVPLGYTIMQSCAQAGIDVPRFCYHDKLLIAGNCRICLVELTGSKKLLASCAVHISKNAYVYTNTARVKLARQNVLEFLLANHPLDCPICDQGGECDLQDITAIFGADRGRFYESEKRAVLNKDFGPLIRTSMNRCIHCTRCVRFMSLSAGMSVLGTLGRGASTEIGSYVGKFLFDELSGNITDLCPVGALTSKPYSFKARPWELVSIEGLDTFDALNANLLIDIAANKICRILPYANELINEGWLTNRARYAYDGLFFQRLNSCLLQISTLQTFDFPGRQVVRRLTNFFIKLSWDAAISFFLAKLFRGNVDHFVADTGASTDLETVFASFETVSLLGGNVLPPLSSAFTNICDFKSIFTFNLSLSDLSRIPSFCFFLGSNPRFEAPLLNLKLTKLQQDFAVPFYRIGASVHYYSYPVTFISNSTRVFLEICEFKHLFCKRFYLRAFAVSPLFLVSAAVLNSINGGTTLVAVFSLLKRLAAFSGSVPQDLFRGVAAFSFFNILGLYSGWIHRCDLAVRGSSAGFSSQLWNVLVANKESHTLSRIFYYNIGADTGFLTQLSNRLRSVWLVYQGSHGSGIASSAQLILPTSTYVERTVFYRNLFGVVQKSLPAVTYSNIPRTDSEIFQLVLGAARKFVFNQFFCFNFNRAIRYNLDLKICVSTLRSSAHLVWAQSFKDNLSVSCDYNTYSATNTALSFYYYTSIYWSYFSYTWKLNNFALFANMNFFSKFASRLVGAKVYPSPIASSVVNYYADSALPVLTASKTMNMCASRYLKKNFSVLKLHL